MTIAVATLDTLDLPLGFRYKPYIPKKRNSVTRTANSVVTQAAATTQIVHGDGYLAWYLIGAYPTEVKSLWDLYNTAALTPYTFVGYWGEVLEVYFSEFEPPTAAGGLFEVHGGFQVLEIVYDYDFDCIS